MSIFPPGTARHGPPSAKRRTAYVARLIAGRERRMDQLADLLAEGYTLSGSARVIGVSHQAVSSMFRDMKLRLGDQAR